MSARINSWRECPMCLVNIAARSLRDGASYKPGGLCASFDVNLKGLHHANGLVSGLGSKLVLTLRIWHGDCIPLRNTSGLPNDRQPPTTNGMVEQTTKGTEAMLILTRKRDDSIKIGENIVIRVMRTARGSVKIGIEAPASVRIVRGELNEFGEIAGAAESAGQSDDDMHDEERHDELAMHSAYNLDVAMQH